MMTSSFPDCCLSDSPLGFNTVYRHWEETWLNKWKTNSETIHLLTKCSRGRFPWLVWVNQCNLNLIFIIKYRTTIQCVWRAAGSMKDTTLKTFIMYCTETNHAANIIPRLQFSMVWYVLHSHSKLKKIKNYLTWYWLCFSFWMVGKLMHYGSFNSLAPPRGVW